MAYKINQIVTKSDPDDRVLVFCGQWHMAFGYGVPERLWELNHTLTDQTCLISSYGSNDKLNVKSQDNREELASVFGDPSAVADFVFLCEHN